MTTGPTSESSARSESSAPGEHARALTEILARRIRAGGPLSFTEFMRECLYHPVHGYYSRTSARRFGDYYTSVDVHPIFGRMLARQFAEMWKLLGSPRKFVVAESAAGVGRLAGHILDFSARELPEFYAALEYVAIERSVARRAEQASHIASHETAGNASSAAEIPEKISAGCIFSNELLDALPVHRVIMERGSLREMFVGFENGRFIEHRGKLSMPALENYFSEQGITLAEGQQAEVCFEACDWIECAGRALEHGFVLTIDYGHEAGILYNEHHNRGTLLAYRDHTVTENILDAPGEQDLTSHVNFTAMDIWGRRAGLARTGLVTQSQFLVALGRANEFADLYEPGQTEMEKLRARLLLKNLIHPEGLGEKFQVLIQHKGIATPQLTGLSGY
ncbi:MAG TPA: SAM-dependent methyltransferase [Candidatus Saccharimonadales bacterium]|jgi:SAM-dependent MidA family methyltransferase|nr:SAM-dependent methyltransferase [Candidatus Saccharimonadales bacterium]